MEGDSSFLSFQQQIVLQQFFFHQTYSLGLFFQGKRGQTNKEIKNVKILKYYYIYSQKKICKSTASNCLLAFKYSPQNTFVL